MLRAARGDEVLGVAGEVDPAALPARSQELLPDGLDQAGVVVADDEADPVEAALDERADEGRPGAALVVPRRQLEAEDPPLAGAGDPGRHEGRHRHDPPAFADLEVRGVQPQIGIRLVGERATPEGRDLGVERRADPGHLALADRGDAQGPDEVVDPPCGNAQHVCLLDDRQQGPLGPAPRLEERGEVRAVADPRDRQLDRPHPGVPAPVAVPVAAGQAALRVTLPVGQARELGHLGFHDRLGEHPDALAQDVDVAVGHRLAQGVEQSHAVVGHRDGPPCRRFLSSNDARMTRWPFLNPASPLLHQL